MWGEASYELSRLNDRVAVRCSNSSDFIVGVDRPLVELSKGLAQVSSRNGLREEDISLNLLIEAGLVSSTHLVNVTSTDPAGFYFEFYGPRIGILQSKSYRGACLGDAEWPIVGNMAMRDYSKVRDTRQPMLSQIELLLNNRRSVYRRLLLPVFSDGGKVSHVLAATIPDLIKIIPSSFKDELCTS